MSADLHAALAASIPVLILVLRRALPVLPGKQAIWANAIVQILVAIALVMGLDVPLADAALVAGAGTLAGPGMSEMGKAAGMPLKGKANQTRVP